MEIKEEVRLFGSGSIQQNDNEGRIGSSPATIEQSSNQFMELIISVFLFLISVVLTDAEIAIIDAALSEIENILKGKSVNLMPKQRQTYGRVAYETEVWVDKLGIEGN